MKRKIYVSYNNNWCLQILFTYTDRIEIFCNVYLFKVRSNTKLGLWYQVPFDGSWNFCLPIVFESFQYNFQCNGVENCNALFFNYKTKTTQIYCSWMVFHKDFDFIVTHFSSPKGGKTKLTKLYTKSQVLQLLSFIIFCICCRFDSSFHLSSWDNNSFLECRFDTALVLVPNDIFFCLLGWWKYGAALSFSLQGYAFVFFTFRQTKLSISRITDFISFH